MNYSQHNCQHRHARHSPLSARVSKWRRAVVRCGISKWSIRARSGKVMIIVWTTDCEAIECCGWAWGAQPELTRVVVTRFTSTPCAPLWRSVGWMCPESRGGRCSRLITGNTIAARRRAHERGRLGAWYNVSMSFRGEIIFAPLLVPLLVPPHISDLCRFL